MSKLYNTIVENSNYELIEKKSKFIANLICIKNKDEAESIIKGYKSIMMPDIIALHIEFLKIMRFMKNQVMMENLQVQQEHQCLTF